MKKILVVFCSLLLLHRGYSQSFIDQNGLKTSVLDILSANNTQPLRYEIATVSFNAFHWQPGGTIVIELFQQYWSAGYEKYILEYAYGEGINSGNPRLQLVASSGSVYRNAKVMLGAPYDLESSFGGYMNRALPVYLDVKDYAAYKVRITYMQDKVDVLTWTNQIKVNTAPVGTNINTFEVPVLLNSDLTSTGRLIVTGNQDHYISAGRLGIGTANPQSELSVKGTITSQKVKVTMDGWADYVFDSAYQLPPLSHVEKFVRQNKHLPEVPSAAEVKKDGIDLGDNQAILLKKIEELTLYILEQNKQLEDQKLINSKLESRLTEIEQRLPSQSK